MRATIVLVAGLCAAWLAAPSAARAPGEAPRPSALFDTRLDAAGWPLAAGDWVAFLALEQRQDLNGDGDREDAVLQVVDVPRLQLHNLGLAVDATLAATAGSSLFAITGDTLAVLVSEAGQGGKDLNGDRDAEDEVLHVVSLATRETVRAGLAGTEVRAAAGRVAVLAPAPARAAGRGLAALGPTGVLQVYDLSTRRTWESGVPAAPGFRLVGDWAAVLTPEPPAGSDLNGDGDLDDSVAQLVNLATQQVTNSRLAAEPPLCLTDQLLAFTVEEFSQGERDLNADRDRDDYLLYVVALGSGEAIPTGLLPGETLAAAGPRVACVMDEADAKRDLNGDGDRGDAVAHLWDFAARRAVNLGADASGGIAAAGDQVVLLTSEAEQGGRDLNGDRDADDFVVQRYDAARRKVVNLRQAAAGLPVVTPDRLAFLVSERDQGEADLNGDRDADDQVAALFVPAANHLVSTHQATSGILALSDRALVFFTPNADESATPCQLLRIR